VPRFRILPLYKLSEVNRVPKLVATPSRTTAVDAGQDIGSKAFCVEVGDPSMMLSSGSGPDSFSPGDIITIDPDKPVRPGDFVLFLYANSDLPVFRRVRAHASGNYPFDLVPLNSAWAVETITSPEQGRFLGRLVRHIRVYA
jgi:SOS-response transcriptional repressor LexA